MSNNPPFAILELNEKQAKFLLANCDSNITMALGLLQSVKTREAAEKIVELNEQFKAIRDMLTRQGVHND